MYYFIKAHAELQVRLQEKKLAPKGNKCSASRPDLLTAGKSSDTHRTWGLRGPQSQWEGFREAKILFSLPERKEGFLGSPTQGLDSILTELSRL
jgi:hypothetical protein